MNATDLARRTEVKVSINGVDITEDVSKYLLSLSFTDNEEDKTDDLQLALEDRDDIWLSGWLGGSAGGGEADNAGDAGSEAGGDWQVGDAVVVNGRPQYTSYGGGTPGAMLTDYRGTITHLNLKPGVPYPIHVDAKGWFAVDEVAIAAGEPEEGATTQGDAAKWATISAVIVQKNWLSDGKDMSLDCGTFEIDDINASGPPSQVSIKGTSLPHTSTGRTEKKNCAWEKVNLSLIAGDIAGRNGMKCMYESSFDPFYERREQVQTADIVYLQGLCKDAGISLKVTGDMLVLFDEETYEAKESVRSLVKGEADILRYRFYSKSSDATYSKCHVSYTDPMSGETIAYTYTPQDADKNGQTLEINEKVSTREEARRLAMKRLRQKNKQEFTAELTLVGDVRLVAGVTVALSGWGLFDGKYIVESGTHSVSGGGYTLLIKLRRALEGY